MAFNMSRLFMKKLLVAKILPRRNHNACQNEHTPNTGERQRVDSKRAVCNSAFLRDDFVHYAKAAFVRHYFSFWRERPHGTALGIIACVTLVRLWFIFSGQLDLVQDEAQYWDWSRRLQLSYYSKGPLIAWIIALFTKIFGNTEPGVRFGAVAGNTLAQLALYGCIAHVMRRPRLAVLALFIANTTPLFMASGVLMTTDNPLLLCWTLGLTCLHAAAGKPDSSWPWAGLTLAVAAGILAKYTMLAFVGIAVLHAIALRRKGLLPPGHVRNLFRCLFLGVLAGSLPILLWNFQNGWVSFKHVGRLAGLAPAPMEAPPLVRFDRFPEYILSQIGLLLPWWFALMLAGGWKILRSAWQEARFMAGGENDPERAEATRTAILLSTAFWPMWGFFLLWSFHTRIYPNWPAMSYVAGIMLAALRLEELLESTGCPAQKTQSRPWQKRLAPLWIGLSLFAFAALHGQELLSRALPDTLNPTARLKGWSDLGRHLDAIRRAMPNKDRVFFFSDAYDVTAAIAFYIPGQPVTYCADFGRRLNQYDIWPGPEEKEGWDAIFVRRIPFSAPDTLMPPMFLRLGKPEAYQSTHRGRPGRKFGVMVVHGFTGAWPRMSAGIY